MPDVFINAIPWVLIDWCVDFLMKTINHIPSHYIFRGKMPSRQNGSHFDFEFDQKGTETNERPIHVQKQTDQDSSQTEKVQRASHKL